MCSGGGGWTVKNRTEREKKKFMSYPVSLEVDENSSSDLGNQDEQEACKVLEGKKRVMFKILKKQQQQQKVSIDIVNICKFTQGM